MGTGAANTTAIANSLFGDEPGAVRLCYDLEIDGYDDWFLPSKGELQLMRENLAPGTYGFLARDYWSSSETAYGDAWALNFGDLTWYNVIKGLRLQVRAARAF